VVHARRWRLWTLGALLGACSSGAGHPDAGSDSGAVVVTMPDTSACRSSPAPAALPDGGVDPLCTASLPHVSFAVDVMPVLATCTGEICHAPWRYDTLVGTRSSACCDHRWLVAPGQPTASHVVEAVLGNSNACVSQMPLDEGSLSQSELATIVAWICQGALDD
jgi:hypothetical protein